MPEPYSYVAVFNTESFSYLGQPAEERRVPSTPHAVDGDTGHTYCGLAVEEFEPITSYVVFGMACEDCKREIANRG